ncbi:hypothetical protein [Parendozoicomonas haliclonae]|uniref:Uncharacterized protein n=1 Tax=Parendozoicomonas haliclonae TaxID=1960125 RepID=A0A1X7AK24_9GAMM|nr:hypothetical protein [Parendozoicomonas haliclonae]SMA47363.1 hypothetical protein EHSB41UT_02385 [Parendozoicomonas haliclonae]
MADIYSPERMAAAQKEIDELNKASEELTKFLQEQQKKRRGIMSPAEAKAAGLTNGR